jgi:hypothetical protein
MLDHAKLMRALEQVAGKIFADNTHAYTIARETWFKIASDPTFIYKIREVNSPWPLPSWQGRLDEVIPVDIAPLPYHVVSVDGSQIYPDRHQGNSCFLINIGSVVLHYGVIDKPVFFACEPYVFSELEYGDEAQDTVNGMRQDLELSSGLNVALRVQNELFARGSLASEQEPCVLLFDGSLIFWHLESKDTQLHDLFLHNYLATLYQLYEARILNAGYISLTKSKELVNLVRIALCNFDVAQQDISKVVDKVVDAHICSFFLPPNTRSIVFQNNSGISEQYPRCLRPYFFYLNVGTEIGRVEIPGWIAQDERLVNQVAQIVLDQSIKGHGYPVVLAEAHEQAVVKGPDREFFYQMLHKIGMTQQRSIGLSQKVIKKRRIGI